MRRRIDNQGSNEMLDLFFSKCIYTALRLLAVTTKPYDTRSAHQPILIWEGSHPCSELISRELGWQQDHMPWRRFLENSECVHGERGERIWKYRPKSIYTFCGDPSLFIWGQYAVANNSRHGVWADPDFYPTTFGGLGFSEPLEYVRSNAIPTSDKWDRQLRYELQTGLQGAPGLAQVLLMQIAWFTFENIGYLAFPRLHQGAWAGDRLDIQSYKNLISG